MKFEDVEIGMRLRWRGHSGDSFYTVISKVANAAGRGTVSGEQEGDLAIRSLAYEWMTEVKPEPTFKPEPDDYTFPAEAHTEFFKRLDTALMLCHGVERGEYTRGVIELLLDTSGIDTDTDHDYDTIQRLLGVR